MTLVFLQVAKFGLGRSDPGMKTVNNESGDAAGLFRLSSVKYIFSYLGLE